MSNDGAGDEVVWVLSVPNKHVFLRFCTPGLVQERATEGVGRYSF